MNRSQTLMALAAAGMLAAAPAVAAPHGPTDFVSPFGHPVAAPAAKVKPVMHVMVGSFSNTGNNHQHIPAATATAIDTPVPFTCASANGCTVLFSSNVQGITDADGGRWAICAVVDDLAPVGYCPYQGLITVAETSIIRHGQFEVAVAKGKHSVHTEVYFDQGGTVNNFSVRYDITTP
jgi:hypothetical protein